MEVLQMFKKYQDELESLSEKFKKIEEVLLLMMKCHLFFIIEMAGETEDL